MARNVVRRSVSFEPEDDAAVSEMAALVGGFSAALRYIIRRWKRLEDGTAETRAGITEEGRQALSLEKDYGAQD